VIVPGTSTVLVAPLDWEVFPKTILYLCLGMKMELLSLSHREMFFYPKSRQKNPLSEDFVILSTVTFPGEHGLLPP